MNPNERYLTPLGKIGIKSIRESNLCQEVWEPPTIDFGQLMKQRLAQGKISGHAIKVSSLDPVPYFSYRPIWSSDSPSTERKETRNMNINLNTLLAYAGANTQDDLTVYEALPADLRADIEAQLADERAAARKAAASEIVQLLKNAQAQKDYLVGQIRHRRAEEKRLMSQLKDIERATDFGAETGNYLPLAVARGDLNMFNMMGMTPEQRELAKIPADWKKKEPVQAELPSGPAVSDAKLPEGPATE